jgi:hypothetical protein
MIIDALQHQNPEVFTPRAVYDGNKNLYSSHELQFKQGPGTGDVSFLGRSTIAILTGHSSLFPSHIQGGSLP